MGDDKGGLKYVDYKNWSLVKNYRKVHEYGIWSMAITLDKKYLFTTDCKSIELKQWDLKSKKLVKSYSLVLYDEILDSPFSP